MPQFAANTSFLFTEVEFLQRFDAARKAGFRGVEFHFPYAWQHADLERAARDAGVEVVPLQPRRHDGTGASAASRAIPPRSEFRDGVAQRLSDAILRVRS
jgi:hydroxypyruvate isomerase